MPESRPRFVYTPQDIRRIGRRVAAIVADHLSSRPDSPAFSPVPPVHATALRTAPLPRTGSSIESVLDEFVRDVDPYPFGNGHPRFFGWVNSPPALVGIFADALAAAMNPSVAGGNHAAVYIEHAVASWLIEILGLPADAKGLLVSGTSAAAIVALNAARFAACERIGWDVRALGLQSADMRRHAPRLAVYKSAEGHACHQKAAELLGLGANSIRQLPTDRALRIDPRALDEILAADRATGVIPMAVVATAGTVNTGAIDPLREIAEVCARNAVWLHVDGAYGSPAILSPEFRETLSGLALADSVAMDPHKWLYVPVDAGFVVVRDAKKLRAASTLVPPYLRTDDDEGGVQGPTWYSEFGIEQTRPFRALKVWMALKTFGVDGYRSLIEHDIALARYLASLMRADSRFEVWEPQGLSIVCFRARFTPSNTMADDVRENAINRRILRAVQLGGGAFLSGTVIDGRFWLRACLVNPRTEREDIDILVQEVRAALSRLAPSGYTAESEEAV